MRDDNNGFDDLSYGEKLKKLGLYSQAFIKVRRDLERVMWKTSLLLWDKKFCHYLKIRDH